VLNASAVGRFQVILIRHLLKWFFLLLKSESQNWLYRVRKEQRKERWINKTFTKPHQEILSEFVLTLYDTGELKL